jgi:hypothetical protein
MFSLFLKGNLMLNSKMPSSSLIRLLLVTILGSTAALPGLAAIQVSQPHSESAAPVSTSQSTASQATAPSTLIAQRGNGRGIRRGDFCYLSPGLMESANLIWSDRPLFAWQGKASKIILTTFDNDYNSVTVWEQSLSTSTQAVVYADTTNLQPGQTYSWKLLGESDDPTRATAFSFQIMSAEQRSQISTDLQTIATQLQSSGQSAEQIALEQAKYFQAKAMWSDALQILYSVQNPSPAVTQAIQDITAGVCSEAAPV